MNKDIPPPSKLIRSTNVLIPIYPYHKPIYPYHKPIYPYPIQLPNLPSSNHKPYQHKNSIR